jgi:uncharacterized protein GlcG (DUF336 family)
MHRKTKRLTGVVVGALLALVLTACTGPGPTSGGDGSLGAGPAAAQGPASALTAQDVLTAIETAARSVAGQPVSIAVVDRVGNILGVFSFPGSSATNEEFAVGLARTGAFFSHDQGPLSSELIRFLSRENFPEQVKDTPSADLFGIELTNRGCALTGGPGTFPFLSAAQTLPPARNIPGTGPGTGVVTQPGGFPLFKNNRMVGGIGVFGSTPVINEYMSLTAYLKFSLAAPDPGVIYLEGVILPFTQFFGARGEFYFQPAGTAPGDFPAGGNFRQDVPGIGLANVRGSPILTAPFAPEGYLIGPVAGNELTAGDVDAIIQAAIFQANNTRAAIRLPPGQRCRMVFAVAEGSSAGPIPKGTLLAFFRMPDATVFSADVAAVKAKNAVYFSDPLRDPRELPGVAPGISVTARTIGFGAQTMFPSGIAFSGPGPFRSLFTFTMQNPCRQGQFSTEAVFPAANESGIVFFPGSTALYRNGRMIGGFGASGDGVAQDDVITDAGARGFLPANESQRADSVIINGVRLPYFKFSRNPEE